MLINRLKNINILDIIIAGGRAADATGRLATIAKYAIRPHHTNPDLGSHLRPALPCNVIISPERQGRNPSSVPDVTIYGSSPTEFVRDQKPCTVFNLGPAEFFQVGPPMQENYAFSIGYSDLQRAGIPTEIVPINIAIIREHRLLSQGSLHMKIHGRTVTNSKLETNPWVKMLGEGDIEFTIPRHYLPRKGLHILPFSVTLFSKSSEEAPARLIKIQFPGEASLLQKF